MGILDDAIREHLELKRAHGAEEDEIRRKEAEAFGPVRHDAAPVAEAPEPVLGEPTREQHTQLLSVEDEPLEAAPEDPYAVHKEASDSGVHNVQPVEREEHHVPAAEAGAGILEGHHVEPGPPMAPEHHDEPHPAFEDQFAPEQHPPEPVFRQSGTAEAPVSPPDAPLQPEPEDPYVGDPPFENPAIDEPPPRQSPEHAHEEDEDVLEETPEFLQDAPEHDRLWFEQKPPRDFDFGE